MESNQFLSVKQQRARKQQIIGAGVILFCITALSCVSSFQIYKGGFVDFPPLFANVLALFAVLIVEGTFIWLLRGISKAFSSAAERAIAYIGIVFVIGSMFINVVTHFMEVKGATLHPYQTMWIDYGAVTVFFVVLILVLSITLFEPIARLTMMALKVAGKQQETIIAAQSASLESERVQLAMQHRANSEAESLARKIEGNASYVASLPLSDEASDDSSYSMRGGVNRGHLSNTTTPAAKPVAVDVNSIIPKGKLTRKQPPKLGKGYFWRRNGVGYDLRRVMPNRKQPYLAHLSDSKWQELTKQNRTDSGLREGLSNWLVEKLKGRVVDS